MTPSLEEVKRYAGEYRMVPVMTEMLSDRITPMEVMRKLKAVSSHCYMLESLNGAENWGRYTFLGYDPKLELTCLNGEIHITKEGQTRVEKGNPVTYIQEVLSAHRSPCISGMPSFTGGLVGYFSYDFIKYSEPTLDLCAEDQDRFKDVDLMLFDKVIAFDHFKQKIYLVANVATDDPDSSYDRTKKELDALKQLILRGEAAPILPLTLHTEFESLFSREAYCEMVQKAKHYILEGDIFQVVLSNRLAAQAEGSLFDTYRVLRTTNPSPYMFYFSGEDFEIAGASPETLVKLQGTTLHTFPLAGTRKRGRSREEDEALERELLADEKELAEHNMLVDLGRNDLGKVSRFGSVEVEKYMSIERFSHVMHIGSTVRGELREEKSALDALSAVLPAGTLSGAPKIRACQIINELENNKRGIYGGAIGYLDFSGNMDTCISIRIAYKKNGKVFIRSGAGIVADSVPEKEYEECLNKAKAVIQAIRQAEGGIDV